MKAFYLAALIFSLITAPFAYAAPVLYEFSLSGFTGGGVLSGSFLAEDLNGDGGILSSEGEIFDFEYSLLGDSIVDDIQLTQADFESNPNNSFWIAFSLDNNLVIDGLLDNNPVYQPDSFPYIDTFLLVHYIENEAGTIPLVETVFIAGPDFGPGPDCDGVNYCTYIKQFFVNPDGSSGGDITSGTTQALTLSTVPVPSTAWLFLSAIGALPGLKHQSRSKKHLKSQAR